MTNPQEIREAGDAAVAELRRQRARLDEEALAPGPAAQTTVADFQRRASLEEQLAGVAASRAERQQRLADSAADAAESRADRLRHITEDEMDHADELASKRRDATLALGEFHKAEMDAALRAREEEKAFVAFRAGRRQRRSGGEGLAAQPPARPRGGGADPGPRGPQRRAGRRAGGARDRARGPRRGAPGGGARRDRQGPPGHRRGDRGVRGRGRPRPPRRSPPSTSGRTRSWR